MQTVPPNPDKAPRPMRPMLAVILAFVLGLIITLLLIQMDNQRIAEEEALLSSGALAESAALLLKPLVMSEDRISLNYLLNELANQPMIRGMRLTDNQDNVLGISGEHQGRSLNVPLIRNEEPLGELTVWADPSPLLAVLKRQQLMILLSATATLLLMLIGIWLSMRPARAETAEIEQQDRDTERQFDEVMQEISEADAGSDSLPILDPDDMDDLELPPVLAPEPEPVKVTAPPTPERPAAPQATSDSFVAERDKPNPSDNTFLSFSARDEELNDQELVSLLKPERERGPIPRFTPATAGYMRDQDSQDDEAYVELEEQKPAALPAEETSRLRNNPLLSALDDDEEQLNLYAFEQDLELMLAAEDAGYLLLIDATSAHSELVEEEEHQSLLKTYRMLANSVAVIYNGRVVKAGNADLQMIFDQPQADDTHGVNAMCAAMLFTHLYKQYNQSRIRLFRPVMNLHMALVRGKVEKLERLLEEARFLTRTTQSNELISHTALTEAPDLKRTLLEGASIRREDEDKVLVLQISKSYQDLLEKQSRHLMLKLSQREPS
ncbi:hypothetical protein [Nitrincola sp.]|uniref:hypothetical protein n=1 Tax=Nitrincola sp. TaxID=1926584 RepID=UPI003A8FF4FE